MLRKKYKEEESRKKLVTSTIIGITLLIIASFLIFSNWKINQRREELIGRIIDLQTEIKSLEERREQLNAGISEVSDSDYAEEVLREKGLYKKEGEDVVVIVPPEEEQEEKEKEEEKGIWDSILGTLNLRD